MSRGFLGVEQREDGCEAHGVEQLEELAMHSDEAEFRLPPHHLRILPDEHPDPSGIDARDFARVDDDARDLFCAKPLDLDAKVDLAVGGHDRAREIEERHERGLTLCDVQAHDPSLGN